MNKKMHIGTNSCANVQLSRYLVINLNEPRRTIPMASVTKHATRHSSTSDSRHSGYRNPICLEIYRGALVFLEVKFGWVLLG